MFVAYDASLTPIEGQDVFAIGIEKIDVFFGS